MGYLVKVELGGFELYTNHSYITLYIVPLFIISHIYSHTERGTSLDYSEPYQPPVEPYHPHAWILIPSSPTQPSGLQFVPICSSSAQVMAHRAGRCQSSQAALLRNVLYTL